ncbi:hypothetical protein [Variovorax paradoxus]|uniref:hypothetical protein n=1 Tax=Variovorax paradoxus TaxID=34073 RepID=UPI00193409CA|nr:hypothetical protein INQ48_34735 [Variovorax paradoxus]
MTPLDFLRILSTVSFPATITDEAQLQLVSKLAYLELIDAEISTPRHIRRTYREAGFAKIFGLTTPGILMLQEEGSKSDVAKIGKAAKLAQSSLQA